MNNTMSTLFTLTKIGIVITPFIMEHVCREYELNTRPSIGLKFMVNKSQEVFEFLGKKFALISSFLIKLKLEKFGQTICDIIEPTCKLIISPIYFSFGYVSELKKNVNKQIFIHVGSTIIIVLILFTLDKLGFYYPSLKFAKRFNDYLCVKSLRYNEIYRNHPWLILYIECLLIFSIISDIVSFSAKILKYIS